MSNFITHPRDYALLLVEEGLVDPVALIQMLLNYMSKGAVKEVLYSNELSPSFFEESNDE